MELYNIKTSEFKTTGLSLIRESGEILTLIRYPFQAGNKDFFIIYSEQEFEEFLSRMKPKDSVTIFKTFKTIKEGMVTQDFIADTFVQLNSPEFTDWIVMSSKQKKLETEKWTFANTKIELNDVLQDFIGYYVKIIENPDWLNDKLIFHGYEPDDDGQIRPGSY